MADVAHPKRQNKKGRELNKVSKRGNGYLICFHEEALLLFLSILQH